MTSENSPERPLKGEPPKPIWTDGTEYVAAISGPLDYENAKRQKQRHKGRGRTGLNATAGFFGAIVLFYLSLFFAFGVVVAGPNIALLRITILGIGIGLGLAVSGVMSFVWKYRGTLAGFLLGIGVSVLCPVVAIMIICGR